MAQRKRESMNGNAAQSVAGRRQPGRVSRRYAAPRRRRAPFISLLFSLLAASATWAQGSPAVIAGAEVVNIRRGPGTEFPPFATLTRGTRVEIAEMRGEWARVQTTSGQYGYIRSTFLSPVGERPPAEQPSHTLATFVTPAERQVPTVSTGSARAETPSAAAHPLEEAPMATGQLAATPANTPVAPTEAAELDKLHSDVARLSETVEQLQRRLQGNVPKDSAPPLQTSVVDGGSRVMTSTAILLTAIGLCVGWLLGSAYGRRQERGRRPRVRL